MDIYKFGGSSHRDENALNCVYNVLTRDREPKVSVHSAVGGVTDLLIEGFNSQRNTRHFLDSVYRQIQERISRTYHSLPGFNLLMTSNLAELSNRIREGESYDLTGNNLQSRLHQARLTSWGELTNRQMIAAYLRHRGLNVKEIDSKECMFFTGDPLKASYNPGRSDVRIREQVAGNFDVFIVAGYYGYDENGNILVTSRGGSDYTETSIAGPLGVETCYNCTDVNGISPIDPRLLSELERDSVPTIKVISYQATQELAKQGGRVLHPRSVEPLVERRIPLVVMNTFNPGGPKTRVEHVESAVPEILAVTGKRGSFRTVSLRSGDMEGSSGFFRVMADAFEEIDVDTIATSAVEISVSSSDPDMDSDRIKTKLSSHGKLSTQAGSSLVAIVGNSLGENPLLISDFFRVLGENDIGPLGQITKANDHCLWVSVPTALYENAMLRLYRGLILR